MKCIKSMIVLFVTVCLLAVQLNNAIPVGIEPRLERRFWGELFGSNDSEPAADATGDSVGSKAPPELSPQEKVLKVLEKTALDVAEVAKDLMSLQDSIEPLIGINAAESAAAEAAAQKLVAAALQ